ncbi:MAG TPA: TIGR03067 domain-containing protein [Gemmataceae bacterium]|jgi:uncharacterized protein (TIGR03067 family)|nr:TIGR03067 domain-containing protein [Gemmataceae bacterium]
MKRVPFVVALLLIANVATADDASKKVLKDLEGSYTPVTMTKEGEAAPDEFLKSVSFTIKGERLTVRFKKGDKGEDKQATLVIDASQKPTAIDMTPKDGPEAGKPILGIVKIEKDAVTLCWADRADKSERPKEFTSTKENKHFLIVMKKAKG